MSWHIDKAELDNFRNEMSAMIRRGEDIQRENERARHEDWRQAVTAQHTVLATIAGLQVTALTLFAAFGNHSHSVLQVVFFGLSLLFLATIVVCLVFVVEHERRDAFDSHQVDNRERNLENRMRKILNLSTGFNAITITALLFVTYIAA